MTTKPELKLGSHLVPGIAAVALFVVMAGTFVTASFGSPVGFSPGDVTITANIGYALFDMTGRMTIDSESFLAVFEIIDVVLVAALVGAVMLARREVDGETVTALRSDAEDRDETATDGGPEPGGDR